MKIKLIKIVLSLSLSILSIILYKKNPNRLRKNVMIAMCLSTLADTFMVNVYGIGDFSTYIGAAFFMSAHIILALSFIKESKIKKYKLVNKAFNIGLISVILLSVLLGILACVVPETPQIIMYLLLLVYIGVICFNLVCQFSYAYNEKGLRYFLILAMSLFFISDYVIFLSMVNVIAEHNFIVWLTYIPAQALIIIFNS